MKEKIKSQLRKFKIYQYLKYSYPFYLYEAIFKPEVLREKKRELSFYRSFLKDCDLIFDIGANDGHKTEAFLKIARKVVCCEPDRGSFQTLQIRFRNRKQRVLLENSAVGSYHGTIPMFVHHAGSAFNTVNEKFRKIVEADQKEKWNEKVSYQKQIIVETTTLTELIKKYGCPYFANVEGAELKVI
jgi:FkbM family methyltransferase